RDLANYKAYDTIQELKTMFEEQAKQELFEKLKAFHACKQEVGQLVSSYLLMTKSYLNTLERLGYAMPNELGKAETLDVLAIQEGKIQKDKKKPQGAKGHWRRNCSSYHAELRRERMLAWLVLKGLNESRKLKQGALSLCMGNGIRAAVEAIRSFDLILPSCLIIILDNYHFVQEVSSDDNEMVEVKVLMSLAEDNDAISKKGVRNELKELTTITETWLNSSNKVNQCISKQIPSQKKRILGVYQLTKYPSSSRQKDLVFIKSSADETKVSIPSVKRPWLSKAEGFILPNHDTGRILLAESQRNTTDPLVAVTDSSTTEYDLVGESLVCSTPLSPLKKLDGAEPVSRPKTIKSILRSKSTFKAKTLKGIIINEPSSAPVKGSKISLASKVNSSLAGKLKSMKIEDNPPLAVIMKELNNLKLQISKNQSSYSRNKQPQQVPQYALQNKNKTSSSRYEIPRPSKRVFPPCIHCGCIDHLSNECLYYPIYGLCGSYDHDTNGHNMIISLEREINSRNPQQAFKRCEACGSSTHTTTDHYDIKWFRRSEALQAKKGETLKSTKAESSNANRSKTPTKDLMWCLEKTLHAELKVIALSNVMFDEKRETIFNSNKEVVMIAPRVRGVYVLDMTSFAQQYCFFAKASDNLN
nr:hypothetical protein [Tanacetum cinerariifolium]